MAFDASDILPSEALPHVKNTIRETKAFCANHGLALAKGGTSERIIKILNGLIMFKDRLNALNAIPGFPAYSAEQNKYSGRDFGVSANAIVPLITNAISTIDSAGLVLKYTTDVNLGAIPDSFSAPDLSSIKTKLDILASVP